MGEIALQTRSADSPVTPSQPQAARPRSLTAERPASTEPLKPAQAEVQSLPTPCHKAILPAHPDRFQAVQNSSGPLLPDRTPPIVTNRTGSVFRNSVLGFRSRHPLT